MTMRYFAGVPVGSSHSVIDRTGLQGDFAFAIEWPAEPGEAVRSPGNSPDVRSRREIVRTGRDASFDYATATRLDVSIDRTAALVDVPLIPMIPDQPLGPGPDS